MAVSRHQYRWTLQKHFHLNKFALLVVLSGIFPQYLKAEIYKFKAQQVCQLMSLTLEFHYIWQFFLIFPFFLISFWSKGLKTKISWQLGTLMLLFLKTPNHSFSKNSGSGQNIGCILNTQATLSFDIHSQEAFSKFHMKWP